MTERGARPVLGGEDADLRDRLLALLAPHGIGDEIGPGLRIAGTSVELGFRVIVAAAGERVAIELAPLEAGARAAVRTARFAVGWRTEGGRAGVDAAVALRACEAVARVVASNEGGLSAVIDRPAPKIRRVEVSALLEDAGTHYTLSPYVGCLIGCRFCYAQSRLRPLRRMLGLPAHRWGSWVDVRVNAPELLAAELRVLPPRPIKLCPIVSDPYQAIERDEQLTRRCLQAIGGAGGFAPLVLTRSELVLRDASLLGSIAGAQAGVSLPTVDDDVRRSFEPRGASVEARLRVLAGLRAAGVRTFAVVQPILPGPIDALAARLAELADSVSLDVLRGVESAGDDFAGYPGCDRDEWQRARLDELVAELERRGVPMWPGELPPAGDGRLLPGRERNA